MKARPSGGYYFEVCPLCESPDLQYSFVKHGFRMVQCGGCHLVLLNPQPSHEVLAQIYSEDYFLGGKSPDQ